MHYLQQIGFVALLVAASWLFGKKVGAIAGLTYSKNNRYQEALNRRNALNDVTNKFTVESSFDDDSYIAPVP